MVEQNVTWPAGAGKSRSGQIRVGAAGFLVLAALAYLVWASMPQGTVYYQTVQELTGRTSDAPDAQPVRVAGTVAEGSIRREANLLQFEVLEGADRLPAAYRGVVPDIFGPDIQVVLEGRRDASGVFQAQTLLAKCPSRFESAAPAPPVKVEPRP